MTTYTVNYCDPQTAAETPIGQIGYGEGGMLNFVSAIPSHEDYLRTLVERLNQLPHLSERTVPRPGAPKYTLSARKVSRNQTEFRQVLKDHLQRLYGLNLTTTEPEGAPAERTPGEEEEEAPLPIPGPKALLEAPTDTAGLDGAEPKPAAEAEELDQLP
jgi:hypothetical protein